MNTSVRRYIKKKNNVDLIKELVCAAIGHKEWYNSGVDLCARGQALCWMAGRLTSSVSTRRTAYPIGRATQARERGKCL